ncbi:hypothetical protein V8B97DRAFT_2027063 [Scleroderma yunnanense]
MDSAWTLDTKIMTNCVEDLVYKNKRTTVMTYIRSKIKELKANKTLKMHEWVRKKPWLYNHSQGHAQKALLTYGRAWTTRTMIMHQWKKDINMVLEKAGIKQGFAEMIKWYQNAMVKVMKTLTEEEAKEAEELAREWFRNAKKKGQQYAKEFAKEMWKCCGARVVVIAAWKDNDEEVMVTGQVCHDFNDELGNGKCFPDLEHCQQKFTWYSRMIFDMNDDDKGSDSNDESRHMVRKTKARPQISLPTHEDGTSYIPNILNLHVLKMKDIMRAFVTFHYWNACGKPTATVSWASKYLLHGVTFKEPTCLTPDELTRILKLWRDHKEHNPDEIFHFSQW